MTCALAIAILIRLAQAAPLPASPNVPTDVWTDLTTETDEVATRVQKIVWSNLGKTETITHGSQTETVVTYMPSQISGVWEYHDATTTETWSTDYLS